jgi:hypothetical protein
VGFFCFWASRFAHFVRSRRAIRSITFGLRRKRTSGALCGEALRWFRYYPSRFAPLAQMKNEELLINILNL